MYIKWKHETEKNGKQEHCRHKVPGAFEWKDKVTGTAYYITKQDYDRYYGEITAYIKGKQADEIVEYLEQEQYSTFPYRKGLQSCTLRDAARLFVLFTYLYYGMNAENKEELRGAAYKVFFAEEIRQYPYAWDALTVMINQGGTLTNDIPFKILYGGVHKIKKYYLETNGLKDMRGASALLTYVAETKIPEKIRKTYIEECIIYAGGGKIFCILPSAADDNIACQLEQIFHYYTLSAQSVFCVCEQQSLKPLLIGYKETMKKVDNVLEERKKLKIYHTICPVTPFWKDENIEINGSKIGLEANELHPTQTCHFCRAREAMYRLKLEQQQAICGSCLHKRRVGLKEKSTYLREYESITQDRVEQIPQDLDGIGDEVAVVYADGNNMGAVVKEIDSIAGMMYFSRKTARVAKNATYQTLEETCKSKRFEIVALGGDDIFLIMPAAEAIGFTAQLIKSFNMAFKNLSQDKESVTLSAGICMGKANSPVRIMLEYAENAMKKAKMLSRENRLYGCDCGSFDFVILHKMTQGGGFLQPSDKERIYDTLLPYSLKRAEEIIKIVQDMKHNNDIKKSNLYKLKQGFYQVESALEGSLFYGYDQARHKNRLQRIFEKSKMPGLIWKLGYFVGSESGNGENAVLYSPWKDILDLWDYCGGEENA